jgi:hypothetical protein
VHLVDVVGELDRLHRSPALDLSRHANERTDHEKRVPVIVSFLPNQRVLRAVRKSVGQGVGNALEHTPASLPRSALSTS